jgi:Sulfotransferase family
VTEAPVFIVGSMRSGSTMLRLILDSHPNIAVPPETGFMGAVAATKAIPNWRFGEGWFTRLGWSEDEVNARIRGFYAPMFARFAAQQGKRRWAEKTPFHTGHIPAMAEIFSDAVFVGIVRHPGAVAASLRKNFNYTFSDALSYWTATNVQMVRSASAIGGRFMLCRYEDLVLSTEPVLRDMLGWLGEPWSDDVLRHHAVQREKGAPRAAEGATSTRDPVDPTRAGQWASSLSSADREALVPLKHHLAFFGYDRTTSPPVDIAPSAAERDHFLVSGHELAARMKAWSGLVDFDIQPPAVIPEGNEHELADRLRRVEGALARTRSRRSVRIGDAIRKVQHGRSWRDVREAIQLVRGGQ